MAFLESPRFPECISIKAVMRPTYRTTVVALASGYKKKNREWSEGLHSFDFSHNALIEAEHIELRDFFHANAGMDGEFRVKDYTDYTTSLTDGVLLPIEDSRIAGTTSGPYGTKTYVLAKAYVAGAKVSFRFLQKPVVGTTTVYRNGSPVTVGAAAGEIALDTTTGIVNFVADQSQNIISHTPGASHVFVVTAAFSPNVAIGQRVYIDGVTGTAGAVLSGFSHVVTNVSTSTITISTSTVGLSVTLDGTARLFAQTTETLAVVTEFDVPCMFSSDAAELEVIDKRGGGDLIYAWSGINLEEIRIPLP